MERAVLYLLNSNSLIWTVATVLPCPMDQLKVTLFIYYYIVPPKQHGPYLDNYDGTSACYKCKNRHTDLCSRYAPERHGHTVCLRDCGQAIEQDQEKTATGLIKICGHNLCTCICLTIRAQRLLCGKSYISVLHASYYLVRQGTWQKLRRTYMAVDWISCTSLWTLEATTLPWREKYA